MPAVVYQSAIRPCLHSQRSLKDHRPCTAPVITYPVGDRQPSSNLVYHLSRRRISQMNTAFDLNEVNAFLLRSAPLPLKMIQGSSCS